MTCFLKPGSCGDAKFLIWVSGWISLRLPDLYKKIFRSLCRPCSTTVYPSMHWAKREEWKTFQLEQGVPDLFLQSNIFRLYLRGTEVFLSQMGWIKTTKFWMCPRASFQLDVPGNPLEKGIQSHPNHIPWANSSDSFYTKEQWHYFELTLSLRLILLVLFLSWF